MYKARVNQQKEISIEPIENGFVIDGKEVPFDIISLSENGFHIIQDYKGYRISVAGVDKENKTVDLVINGQKYLVEVKDRMELLLEKMGMNKSVTNKLNLLKAPMPGMVLQVLVSAGQQVKKGDSILILEAMKMENIIKSPGEGIVKKVLVNAKDKVEKNAVMVEFE